MTITEIYKNIMLMANDVQQILDAEFRKCQDVPLPGSALDQAGLQNGKEIVKDCISQDETGIALEPQVYRRWINDSFFAY